MQSLLYITVLNNNHFNVLKNFKLHEQDGEIFVLAQRI